MDNLVFLDVEASSLGRGSYPIQIGVALRDGEIRRWLVRPEPEWTHWDLNAQRVHGLGKDLLTREGLPARQVAEDLNGLLWGKTVYSDAWANDNSWVALLFDAAELVPRFRLESLRTLLSDPQAANWKRTKEIVLTSHGLKAHDAGVDAWVLRETWLKLQRQQAGRLAA